MADVLRMGKTNYDDVWDIRPSGLWLSYSILENNNEYVPPKKGKKGRRTEFKKSGLAYYIVQYKNGTSAIFTSDKNSKRKRYALYTSYAKAKNARARLLKSLDIKSKKTTSKIAKKGKTRRTKR